MILLIAVILIGSFNFVVPNCFRFQEITEILSNEGKGEGVEDGGEEFISTSPISKFRSYINNEKENTTRTNTRHDIPSDTLRHKLGLCDLDSKVIDVEPPSSNSTYLEDGSEGLICCLSNGFICFDLVLMIL
jgi:hypothetical protein